MDFLKLYQKQIDNGYLTNSRKEYVIKFLDNLSHKNVNEIYHLSFRDIASIIDKTTCDNELFELINTLESSEIKILVRKYKFVDEEGYEEEIDDSDFNEILKNGEFFHPVTGEEVEEWRSHIFPFFVLSDEVKERSA